MGVCVMSGIEVWQVDNVDGFREISSVSRLYTCHCNLNQYQSVGTIIKTVILGLDRYKCGNRRMHVKHHIYKSTPCIAIFTHIIKTSM